MGTLLTGIYLTQGSKVQFKLSGRKITNLPIYINIDILTRMTKG
jgi:hypothetical protein